MCGVTGIEKCTPSASARLTACFSQLRMVSSVTAHNGSRRRGRVHLPDIAYICQRNQADFIFWRASTSRTHFFGQDPHKLSYTIQIKWFRRQHPGFSVLRRLNYSIRLMNSKYIWFMLQSCSYMNFYLYIIFSYHTAYNTIIFYIQTKRNLVKR